MKVKKGKFAFIGHPLNMDQYRDYIRFLRPDKTYKDAFLIKLFEWAPSYKVLDWENFSLNGSDHVDGMLIMVPFLPEMREMKFREVTKKIEQAISIAQENNCEVASLGAYASIVMLGREMELENKYKIKITSGNTMTSAVIIKSIEDLAQKLDLDLSQLTFTIVGASGDIGTGCAIHFCDKVKKLILNARGLDLLEDFAAKNKKQINCELEFSLDNKKAIEQSQIVICATSSYKPIFSVDEFNRGTIICDASAPKNVETYGQVRNDVFLYHGGLAKTKMEFKPGFDTGIPSPNIFAGCQLESAMIAQDSTLPCSWGRGNISRDKINVYLDKISSNSDISMAYTSGDKIYTSEEIEDFKNYLAV